MASKIMHQTHCSEIFHEISDFGPAFLTGLYSILCCMQNNSFGIKM